jgi:hypothetical protein
LHFAEASDALCTSQFRGRSKGLHAGTPWTSDADFEAINACFQAPLEDASAFEFMNLRTPGLSALGFPWAVRGFDHDERNSSSSTVADIAGIDWCRQFKRFQTCY